MVKFSEDELKKDALNSLVSMDKQGMPQEILTQMVRVARPVGDFEALRDRYHMDDYEFEKVFSGDARKYGLDGKSVPDGYAYGASGIAKMLGWSPYGETPEDVWLSMKGMEKSKPRDAAKEMIFFSGHAIEPVYRKYFKRLYGNRYKVITCDAQWHSKIWSHFIGNVDGFVVDKETGELGILEIKHTDPSRNSHVKVGFTNCEGEYASAEESFINTPETKGYLMQGDAYMEMFHGVAKFVCFFLGMGNRCNYDSTAMVRIERDETRGKELLDSCEAFIKDYVIADIRPDYRMVKNPDTYKKALRAAFPCDESLAPMDFSDSLSKEKGTELLEAQNALNALKEEKKELEKKLKAAQDSYEEAQADFIVALGNHTKGHLTVDGKTYDITYKSRAKLDILYLRKKYPDIAAACTAPGVDTEQLKQNFKEVYEECAKGRGKREFTLKAQKVKTKTE